MKLRKICASVISAAVLVSNCMLVPAKDIQQGSLSGALAELQKKFSVTQMNVQAASGYMRRPCSPDAPMLIVHIDTWNVADPAKIVALIPDDLKPYVVFNLSLSIYWNNHQWGMVQDGYQCAKSWLRTCADEGVWTMIQPASGGQCHFPDYTLSGQIVDFPNKAKFSDTKAGTLENTMYEEFFRDYPNFIGFNYSEQFWGFESEDFPVTPIQRYEHFSQLLSLCNKYGGYLNINWCANQWSAPLNPVAMLKRCTAWRESCEKYSQNLILEEKYTQGSFISDVESEVLGAYLSGYCGNFGVRYDETGWTDADENGKAAVSKDQYRQITGLPIELERMVLNGATVIDGPELVWQDDFRETSGTTDSDGYHVRGWDTRDQYDNATLDSFRKVVDGSIDIPSRQEVIDRTKVVIVQDNLTGDDHNKYSTYPTLFEGLYRMPGDGNQRYNNNLYKCTGRYPTIPTVYSLRDDAAKSFDIKLNQSALSSRWTTIQAKQDEFNKLFGSDYYGNCYAGRFENSWVTYNPNKCGTEAGGVLSLKYNTCKTLDCKYSAYGSGLINEYSDHIDIYANNYDNKAASQLRTDVFKISGCTSKPVYTYKDRGVNQTASKITESYDNGTYTLNVSHNGPVDISVKCSGLQTDRLAASVAGRLTDPAYPQHYEGIRQYEGELFDSKNIESNAANACGSGVTGCYGQGFIKFGSKANAAVKDTVKTQKSGSYKMTLRYSTLSDINNVDLYVNGSKTKTLSLSKGSSYSDWKTVSQNVELTNGDNKIEFKASSALAGSLYIDCFTVEGDFGSVGTGSDIIADGTLIKNLKVNDSENRADWKIAEDFKTGSLLYGDRDLTGVSVPMQITGAEYIMTACDSKMYTSAQGAFDAAKDMTVYAAVDSRVDSLLSDWLGTWTKTSLTMSSSNSVTFNLYRKSVKSGETVTLGSNGAMGESANYIVFAADKQISIKGDVNADGVFNIKDVVLLQKWMINCDNADLADWQAGDINGNQRLDAVDFCQMKNMILESAAPVAPVTHDEYMKQISSKIVNVEPAGATAESADVKYGTYEKKTIYSAVCKRNKSFNVLLPAGYSTQKKYPVLYALHGYWGNEDALLDKGDASLRLRQIIGNAIASGEAEDMIVVFPDIYASDTQDKCSGLDAKNNAAYDNFINLLTKEIMPYMEKNYSVKTGRDNTALTGFSMGGRESLYIGFSRPDLFGYVGAMCPAPGVNELIPAQNMKFGDVSPYLLLISAGSNDTLIWSTPAGYHDTLTSNGVTHIWHYVSGGDHGGKTIRPHMYNFVRSVFKAV